jgi:hypothetical protein
VTRSQFPFEAEGQAIQLISELQDSWALDLESRILLDTLAAQPGTRDALGLAALAEQALPVIAGAVTAAGAGAPEGVRPVALTELPPLARYGHLALLAQWSDRAARQRQATWAVVPQMVNNYGPLVDGRPLPLAAPGQSVRLDAGWLAAAPEEARV